jgi:ubiquinone/menaquinone biosynthesis C-methylase UbiE
MNNDDAMFSGAIGTHYDLLKQLSPISIEMSRLVGVALSEVRSLPEPPLNVVELGTGTGITTLSLLLARDDIGVLSIDNEPTMQNQAKASLAQWQVQGKLVFCGDDALTALKNIATATVDVVASAYTVHNFLNSYRFDVLKEVFRILKPGGQFINGDRYALDDISKHTRAIQEEVSNYFRVLIAANKLDVLEQWIVHIVSDESEDHAMRESVSLKELHDCGFTNINLTARQGVNALVTAIKPLLTA